MGFSLLLRILGARRASHWRGELPFCMACAPFRPSSTGSDGAASPMPTRLAQMLRCRYEKLVQAPPLEIYFGKITKTGGIRGKKAALAERESHPPSGIRKSFAVPTGGDDAAVKDVP
jgi:hypothetical protein